MAFVREHAKSLSAVLASAASSVRLDDDETPLRAHFVTANFFTELGAVPRVGRLLDPGRDEQAGAEPVAVLSQGLWQRRFGADPSVVGTRVLLSGKPVTVIGVAPVEFSGLSLTPRTCGC